MKKITLFFIATMAIFSCRKEINNVPMCQYKNTKWTLTTDTAAKLYITDSSLMLVKEGAYLRRVRYTISKQCTGNDTLYLSTGYVFVVKQNGDTLTMDNEKYFK